jgi:hypothetical protein
MLTLQEKSEIVLQHRQSNNDDGKRYHGRQVILLLGRGHSPVEDKNLKLGS